MAMLISSYRRLVERAGFDLELDIDLDLADSMSYLQYVFLSGVSMLVYDGHLHHASRDRKKGRC